jgi:hypothetical protein
MIGLMEPLETPSSEEYLKNPRECPPSEWPTEIRLALSDGVRA